MSNPFIQVTTPPTEEQVKAANLQREQELLVRVGKQLLYSTINSIKGQWDSVWANPLYTPAEKLAAMGTDAVAIFQTSALFTAAIYAIDSSLIDTKYLSAGLPYTAHEDGTITLV